MYNTNYNIPCQPTIYPHTYTQAVFWVQIYEENKPKFDPEEVRRGKRPTLVDVEDVSEDLRDMLKKGNSVSDEGTASDGGKRPRDGAKPDA